MLRPIWHGWKEDLVRPWGDTRDGDTEDALELTQAQGTTDVWDGPRSLASNAAWRLSTW